MWLHLARPRSLRVHDAWTRRYAREAWRGGPDEALAPWLARLPPGPRLDLGAGGGRTHAAVGDAVALDWVRASIAALPRPVVGDMAALPFRDGAFAAVVAVHALGHVQDLSTACAEATRVLAPGGALLAVEFERDDVRAALRGAGSERTNEGILTRHPTVEELSAWFAGMRRVEEALVERATRYGPRRRAVALLEKP